MSTMPKNTKMPADAADAVPMKICSEVTVEAMAKPSMMPVSVAAGGKQHSTSYERVSECV